MRARTSELGSPQVMIEPMRRRHLPAVIRIEHRAHPKPWSLGVFTSELAQGDARYYVVMRVDGKVVGYGGLMFVVDEAHVTNLAIAPSMRRQGLGTLLLAHLAARRLPARVHCDDPGGPRRERGRPGPLPQVRLRDRRPAAQLLPRDRRGRAHHVALPAALARSSGPRHRRRPMRWKSL